MSITCEVSQFDKFNEINDEQQQNITLILKTYDVSKDDKFNEINDEHS